jgi:hypothetical protein
MNHWVMDYETLSDCFVAVFEHYTKEERKIFVVSRLQNDFDAFVKFLHENQENEEIHISFNGIAFDAQITEYILLLNEMWAILPGEDIAGRIYEKAQEVIDKSSSGEWLDFYEGNMHIRQLDVFKLNHWDNPAKRSSLKWIQFTMDYHNVEDMPIHHSDSIRTKEDLDMVIDYCINDVHSTKQILHKSKKQVNLRRELSKKYKINLFSASEPKISKELFLLFLSEKTGIPKKEIKYSKTRRNEIVVKDIILPYVKFNHPILKDVHEEFKKTIIDPEYTKGALSKSIIYHGAKTKFGLGGIHGARDSGLYVAKDGMIIMTSDVKSYYPNLAIRNQWAPAHLPKKEFCEQYEWFYDERIKIPKSDPRNYVYKIVLNSTYGLSNDKFSFLYDPQLTMQITVNGQLSMLMLYEMIMERIPGAIPLMQNTDGLETMIPADFKEEYLKVCKEWEEMTDLVLEHDQYQKLILADVNSYIAVHNYHEVTREEYNSIVTKTPWYLTKVEKGKYFYAPTKCKGRLEFEDLPLHKDKSALIVRKAIFNYFIHDIPPEKTINESRNIYDFCIGKRIKGNWYFEERYVEDQEYKTKTLTKTVRYYMSKTGSKIVKINKSDGRELTTEAGKSLLTVFNKYVEKEWLEYNINTKYYLDAVYRELDNILGKKEIQTTLNF